MPDFDPLVPALMAVLAAATLVRFWRQVIVVMMWAILAVIFLGLYYLIRLY
jgi:hypothetical protein